MRRYLVLVLVCVYCFYQVLGGVPPIEELCGMIVDKKVEQKCLDCFTLAGNITQNPEEVRNCTAVYLPPELAECSIPDAETRGIFKINQGGGEFHNNHTNANYLPTCLTRRLRTLVKYQKNEERFVRQASVGVKYIMDSKLLRKGGQTMLNIRAMTSIMELQDIKTLVEEFVSRCKEENDDGGDGDGGSDGGEMEDRESDGVLRNNLMNNEDELIITSKNIEQQQQQQLQPQQQEEIKNSNNKNEDLLENSNIVNNEDDLDIVNVTNELITALENIEQEQQQQQQEINDSNVIDMIKKKKPLGNSLPFGGTNNFAKRVLLYKCITSAMFENVTTGSQVLDVVMKEDFFNPIPSWWVEPLLKTAKEINERKNY